MKKLGTLILVLALLCTCLAGCGNDGNVDRGDDGYIGDNGNSNNNGNNDNGIIDPDDDGNILDPDNDILDPDDNATPSKAPENTPALNTQIIAP